MMQSVRERIPELAVLKTLGFTDGGVTTLVLAESLLLCVFAALVGPGLAALIFPWLGTSSAARSRCPAERAASGRGRRRCCSRCSAGLPPAWRANRLDRRRCARRALKAALMSALKQISAISAMNLRSMPQRLGTSSRHRHRHRGRGRRAAVGAGDGHGLHEDHLATPGATIARSSCAAARDSELASSV